MRRWKRSRQNWPRPSKRQSKPSLIVICSVLTDRFRDVPIIAVSASPSEGVAPLGLDRLAATLVDFCPVPVRSSGGPFVFAVDHCFPIKGQGTVLTGTVLSGSVEANDTIEIPSMKV